MNTKLSINAASEAIGDVRKQYDALKTTCPGFSDPEERCPRDPFKCVCYPVRQRIERGTGDIG